MVDPSTRDMLRKFATLYETPAFLEGDPSWFMHHVEGDDNREATAFVASCLSFGSRKLFMEKIRHIVDCAGGDVDAWVRNGRYACTFSPGCRDCFYRFFSCGDMCEFLDAYRRLMDAHGTLGGYVQAESGGDGHEAVKAVCRWFGSACRAPVVPKDATSACKRVCMFLRWMVRDSSPVDLGLWSGFIDRRTLVMPLDTHVVHQAMRLGLLGSPSAGCNETFMQG